MFFARWKLSVKFIAARSYFPSIELIYGISGFVRNAIKNLGCESARVNLSLRSIATG
jgi:hypothetical protein